MGNDIELHSDKHVLSSELLLVDYGRVKYGTQQVEGSPTGAFAAYEVESNGKQLKEQIAGYYTLEHKQAAAGVLRGYGIT